MAYNTFKPIVTDGLVLYLDAANTKSYTGSGVTWYDLTSNGIDGTLINSPTFNTNNGGYLSFDGTSQYVDISSIAPYLTNTSNFSYATILKTNSPVFYNRHFFSYGDPGSYPDDLTFFCDNGNIVALQVNNLSDGSSDLTYDLSDWTHLSVVYDGTQVGNQNRLKLYINGVQQTLNFGYTVPSTTSPNLYSSAWIGGYSSNSGNFLNFDTSFVTIYNKSLSYSEVLQNYNALKNRFI